MRKATPIEIAVYERINTVLREKIHFTMKEQDVDESTALTLALSEAKVPSLRGYFAKRNVFIDVVQHSRLDAPQYTWYEDADVEAARVAESNARFIDA